MGVSSGLAVAMGACRPDAKWGVDLVQGRVLLAEAGALGVYIQAIPGKVPLLKAHLQMI